MILALGGNSVVPENYNKNPTPFKIPAEFIFFIFFVVIQILASILGRSKSWWAGGVIGALVGAVCFFIFSHILGIILGIVLTPIGLLFDYIVSKSYNKYKSGGGNPPWFLGGGGFGGRSGGGFGGFGGGDFSGGGASGDF